MTEEHCDSFLLVDCGSATTRASLIDLVDGVYRLIASGEATTTTVPPDSDVTLGLRQAISQIEAITDRRLLGDDSHPIVPETSSGDGTDALLATVSAARPLRITIAGLAESLSVAAALRAVQGTYVVVQHVFALDGSLESWGSAEGRTALVNALQRRPSEAIIIVGGTDGGATIPLLDLADTVRQACAYMDPTIRPHIIISANHQAKEAIIQRLADIAVLHPVANAQSDVPTPNPAPLHDMVERLYLERRTAAVPGIDLLRQWSSQLITLPPAGLDVMVRFLAQWRELDILVADIGGGATTLAAVHQGQHGLTVAADLGTGRGARAVLAKAGSENIARWLPSDWGATGGQETGTANRGEQQPRAEGPKRSAEASLLERAVAREALRLARTQMLTSWDLRGSDKDQLPPFDLVVGSGGVLARATDLAEVVLILLDGLEPRGVINLALDPDCLLARLGALARFQPLAAAQVLRHDALLPLGPVIAPVGQASPGDPVLRLRMQRSDGSSMEKTVSFGSIEVLPLGPGQRAIVEMHPTHQFDVGLGQRGKDATTGIEGGAVGLIVDARGRPLILPEDDAQRDAQINQTRQAMRSGPIPLWRAPS